MTNAAEGTGSDAAEGGAGHTSPLAVTRVSGLPVGACALTGQGSPARIAAIAAVNEELEKLRPELVDACFHLVPRLEDDRALRRRVLDGKRAAHRLAELPWGEDVCASVAERADDHMRALVEQWRSLTGRRTTLHRELVAALSADRADALDRLRAALDHTAFTRSLALVAPDWFQYGRPRAAEPSVRDLRTLYSYVTRTAVKTSPLAALTTVGVPGTRGAGRSRSRTSIVVAHYALRRLARDESTAGLLRYRAAPVRPGGPDAPNGLLLHAELGSGGGKIWRHDRVIEADYALAWLEALPPDTESLTLDAILAAVGGRRPFARMRRLLDTGVLHPVIPWAVGEEPLEVLAGLVDGTDGALAPEALHRAHHLGGAAATQDGPARTAATSALRELARPWFAAEGSEPGVNGLIYEDTETDLDLPDPLGEATVRSDLAELTARMRPYIFRSHIYDVLVERFVAEYGSGGQCRDPLGFLMRLTVERDTNPAIDRAAGADRRARTAPEPGPRAWLPVGPSSAPPTSAVFFQLAAESYADVAAGRHRLVVNQFNAGTGGLFTRFGSLLGEDFRRRLAEHVRRLWPEAEVHEFVVGSDSSAAQAECAGTFPQLWVPGEVPGPDGVSLSDTVLAHDPATGTLTLYGPAGTPIGLAYLGLVPQHMLGPFPQMLAILADPWVNASPHTDHTLPFEYWEQRGAEVVSIGREVRGRVVTKRATWIVPVGELPVPRAGAGDDAEAVLRAEEFRRAHGVGEEVFVQQLGGMDVMMAGAHKPLWVSLTSPVSLTVLAEWLRPETTHVRVVEALPGAGQHPQRDSAGEARATEHVALTHWSRPQKGWS